MARRRSSLVPDKSEDIKAQKTASQDAEKKTEKRKG